jgi:hypothetical protein
MIRSMMHGRFSVVALALCLGAMVVGGYDLALSRSRYAYSADSASYVEMAQTLVTAGSMRVTPWDIDPIAIDAIPQPLFPPGFALLIAAFMPFTSSSASAALVPSRLSAALIPCLFLLLWRPAARASVLLGVGLWVLLSPGVRQWHYLAYSDITMLALAIAALGLLYRGLLLRPQSASQSVGGSRWLWAGLLAGLCYAVRNAGLAVIAASLLTLAYACARRWLGWRAVTWWLTGLAGPVGGVWLYNLQTFAVLQPYLMPASTRTWQLNVTDYALSQLADLGVPFVQHPLVALGIVVLLFALGGYSWWRCRAARGSDYAEHVLLTVTGSYGLCGAALLIISRSRYEWGTLIDARNVLQYSFVVLLFLLSAARVLLPAWARTVALVGAVALFVSNAALATRDAVSAYQAPAEPWLVLSEDHALIATVGAMAPEQLLASNAAPLLRLIAHKPVRQLDLVGENGDLAAALRELSVVGHARRPVFFLVCDGMAQDFPMCQTQQAPKGAHCQSVRLDAPFVARCDGFGGP